MTSIARAIVALALFLPGCQTLAASTSSDEFVKASREYNRLVRWQELDVAASLYVGKELLPEFEKRVAKARDIKPVDYRVTGMDCKPEKRTAEVRVEMDYYVVGTSRLRTLVDLQKWVYREEPERKGWFLVTPLPEFK